MRQWLFVREGVGWEEYDDPGFLVVGDEFVVLEESGQVWGPYKFEFTMAPGEPPKIELGETGEAFDGPRFLKARL
jgi:hypothetical protein